MNALWDSLFPYFSVILLPNLSLISGKFIIIISLLVPSPPIPIYRDTIPNFNLVRYHEILFLTTPPVSYHHKKYLAVEMSAVTFLQKMHTSFITLDTLQSSMTRVSMLYLYSDSSIDFISSDLFNHPYFININTLFATPYRCALVKC